MSIKKLELDELQSLKETSIRVTCGLIKESNKSDFFKDLIDLVKKYEEE